MAKIVKLQQPEVEMIINENISAIDHDMMQGMVLFAEISVLNANCAMASDILAIADSETETVYFE